MRTLFLYLFGFVLLVISCKNEDASNPLEGILNSAPSEVSELIQKDEYDIQILYTQVDRDEQNIPHLTSHSFNVEKDKYYYPASTVKMPVAFLALEHINTLAEQHPDVNRSSPILFDAGTPPQSAMVTDSTSSNGYPTVGIFVEKIFSVSDNNAYNRLYEFLGQDLINESLKSKGVFTNSRIRTRVGISGFDTEANKFTNPYRILNDQGNEIYARDEYYALYDQFPPLKGTSKGLGYFDSQKDTIVHQPFDMSEKNFINLIDLEASLRRIIFPELYDESERFQLSDEQYEYLYDIMPKTPLEFSFNAGHEDHYYDSYVKFFYNGDSEEDIPEYIKIYNKVGWAYGTLTDCSYIIDLKNEVEFFLTATILVNENQIFNDGAYEYEEKGLPFLSKLGEAVYHYELNRQRLHTPDLSKFE